jgi:hypothetical protein
MVVYVVPFERSVSLHDRLARLKEQHARTTDDHLRMKLSRRIRLLTRYLERTLASLT